MVALAGEANAEVLQHGGLSFEWRAPPGCPEAGGVLVRIESLLAKSPEPAERVQARATITKPETGDTYELSIETAQAAGTFHRLVQATSCEEAGDAAALIIALAVDPNLANPAAGEPADAPLADPAAKPSPETNGAGPVTPAATVEPETVVARDVAPERRPVKSDLSWHASASAVGDAGTLPRPAAGVQLAAGLRVRPIRLELLGTALPDARETVAADRGGDIDLLALGLRGCYGAERGALGGEACVGLEAGRLQGTGVNASWTDTQNMPWVAGRAGVLGFYRAGPRAALRLGLEALLPATRPEFVLENVGPVHRPGRVVGRLELGLELAL